MSEFGSLILFLLVVGLLILIAWFFIFKVKHLRTPDVYCVDGGVKTGKSLVTVRLAIRQYRKNIIKVCIFNFFRRIWNLRRRFHLIPVKELKERPMLYSNMPLRCVKYNHLDLKIILREVRIPYMSVCLIDEASLLADSMLGMQNKHQKRERFDYINEKLTLFLKLYGHYSHGGSCFYNSQQIVDLHFAFRRCTGTYLYVMKNRKFPFFCLLDVREMVHTEDNDVVNTYNKDIDEDNKPLFISKRFYKYYDRYYLSCLTDNLPKLVDYEVVKLCKREPVKVTNIVTLGNYKEVNDFNNSTRENVENA